MQITLEFLEQELTSLQAQRQNALNVVVTADGAIQVLKSLIERASAPDEELPENEDD
jgi:hypothetical protein